MQQINFTGRLAFP